MTHEDSRKGQPCAVHAVVHAADAVLKSTVNMNLTAVVGVRSLTASLMKVSELAPFHLGSVSGNSWPMSGRHSAPSIASVNA